VTELPGVTVTVLLGGTPGPLNASSTVCTPGALGAADTVNRIGWLSGGGPLMSPTPTERVMSSWSAGGTVAEVCEAVDEADLLVPEVNTKKTTAAAAAATTTTTRTLQMNALPPPLDCGGGGESVEPGA